MDYLADKYNGANAIDTSIYKVLCNDIKTFLPLKKNNQLYDNVKFYVRPLECKLASDYFKKLEYFGPDEYFYNNCVDLESGDPKP